MSELNVYAFRRIERDVSAGLEKVNPFAFLISFPETFVRNNADIAHAVSNIRGQQRLVVRQVSIKADLAINHSAHFNATAIDKKHVIATRIFSCADVQHRVHVKIKVLSADGIEVGLLFVQMF